MPHSIKRLIIALGASVALSVIGAGWWLMPAASTKAAALFAPSRIMSGRYCSNWDFLNNTGQDVNDLHVRLKSVRSVTDVYTGTLNPFGAPDNTSGYEAATDVYRLNFSGATIYDSDQVQIGLCTDAPLLRLDASSQSPFVWTKDNTTVTPNPFFAGLEWNWLDPTHLRIRIVNEQPLTMTLMTLNALDAGNVLALDDLNGDVSSQLPLVSELLSTPMTLAPGADSFFDVFFSASANAARSNRPGSLDPNHPYVIEAVMSDANDDGNRVRLYAQSLSLSMSYLPAIFR